MNTVRLGDIAELKTGPFGTQLSAKEYVANGVPVINVKNIGYGNIIANELDYISQETCNRLAEHILQPGDIVFGRKGSVDRHAYIDEEHAGWFQGSDCIRVRANQGINSHYLSHYLKLNHIKKMVNNAAVGSTMASLNTDILKDIIVELPDIKVQDKIEMLLSSIDEKIENNEKINDNLEHQLQTLFGYLFNRKEIHASCRKGILSDIASITMGQSPSGSSYNEIGEGCLFYQGSTDFGKIFPFPRIYTTQPSRMATVMDTLLSVRAPIGTLNIAFEDCCIGRGLAAIHGVQNNNSYVRYLLKDSHCFFDNINNCGTTFGSLTKDNLYAMPIYTPDSILVQIFEEQANLLEKQIYNNELQNRMLICLRDWLLPMLMNGQATIDD